MKKTRSFLLAAGISLAMAFTFSCSGDDGDNTPAPGGGSSSSVMGGGGSSSSEGTVSVASVSLDKTAATLAVGGGPLVLNATVLPEDATNKAITWASSNRDIALVDDGTVTAVAPGNATITVTTADGGHTATSAVTVVVLCGGQPYDPDEQFCHTDGKTYSCDNKPYNPATQFCDTRDSKLYKKVTIDAQTWMAENLNYEAEGSVCYDDDPDNCAKYGSLYNWATAMDNSASSTAVPSGVQGVCPNGWHLPSDAEWIALTDFVGSTAGTKPKAASGWNDKSDDSSGNGTDDYGFSALPGGYGDGGSFNDVDYIGNWWSASEHDSDFAYSWRMDFSSNDAYWSINIKFYLFSVRCLQD